MLTATTLVHKGAMPIAVHAIGSFRRHFASTHRLEIHTDGTPDAKDCEDLLAAAANPLFPFSDRLPSVFSALGEKAIS